MSSSTRAQSKAKNFIRYWFFTTLKGRGGDRVSPFTVLVGTLLAGILLLVPSILVAGLALWLIFCALKGVIL